MARKGRKDLLLRLAQEIFAKKGFSNATITEIAEAAGVREAAIYNHFKSKEDLLFNIPVPTTEFLIDNLREHLEGLSGAANKLRKLISHYMDFMENRPDYATIILFELRFNRRFYESAAYTSFKRYNQVVMKILDEGAKEGVFRNDVRLSLMRNMIFGAIDHIILSWLLFKRPNSLTQQVDDLNDLILNAIRPKTLPMPTVGADTPKGETQWGINKRQVILKVAESFFAEKGYEKTTISDIAKALNIGEATLYETFKNKEDILFNIPTLRTDPLLDYNKNYLQQNYGAEILLRNFIEHYLSSLQSNKNYLAILIFELKSNRRFYKSNAYKFFKRYNQELIAILKKGQSDGLFRDKVNIYLFRHLIFGTIDHIALAWLLFDRAPDLLSQADDLMKLFMQAAKLHEKDQEITYG